MLRTGATLLSGTHAEHIFIFILVFNPQFLLQVFLGWSGSSMLFNITRSTQFTIIAHNMRIMIYIFYTTEITFSSPDKKKT